MAESEPTDAERLIREARKYHDNQRYRTFMDEIADALEAAIKERDEAREALPIYWRKLAADNDDLKQSLETMTGYYDAERTANAKLTEENRVLRKYMRDAEEMLRNDPFVMVNAANLLNQGLAETARDKPAGANDDR